MASLLRLVAALASTLLVLGFATFTADEAGRGSKAQVDKLDSALSEPAPTVVQEQEREREHGPVREAIDDSNDFLLGPFTGVVSSRDIWAQRLVPTVLALLAWGLGLALIANFLPRPRGRASDWRVA
jgi:hypothetical protein